MIEVRNLTKVYGDNIIFNNVSFNIENGSFVVFSGKSGCGKTTMLNMIGGLEKPTSGHIIVDGTDITKNKRKIEYLRQKTGFLFQNFALIDNKTVKKNLEIIARKNRTDKTVDDVLNEVSMLDKRDSMVYTLSGGEQQRVALARLLFKKCEIVFADEPTGSLDKENAEIVIRLLKKMNKDGKTVIMVTHDEELKSIGDNIINL
ncbi:putative ABC transport system ATP-binding protein [Ruminococcus sp. YE71]|uniref:ABC transporter ATP-binding protein n=1 Tax=unclassified Ruminococcus TaxID=2608920 RepID=UPI000885B53C|nr:MULTISPECIES: ABC transporter ATP-binding protein [unclassified Ruminococcus]SDA28166.1 putative ABC transport system ATP-binding protein [Ruminococcus sp. YE78]SFW35026.1 putative ABC transport system ATP-binding protein [Ruminococcus sp. YE71]